MANETRVRRCSVAAMASFFGLLVFSLRTHRVNSFHVPSRTTSRQPLSHSPPCFRLSRVQPESSPVAISRLSVLFASDVSETTPLRVDNSRDDDGDTEEEESTKRQDGKRSKTPSSISNDEASKFRRIKDIMWVRETLEDLTAAEFACSVEAQAGETDTGTKRKRAVDYEKLLSRLDGRITDMTGYSAGYDIDGIDLVVSEGRGTGRFVYDQQQRDTLFKRVLDTRANLLEVIKGNNLEIAAEGVRDDFGIKLPEIPEFKMDVRSMKDDTSGGNATGPQLYVREDGTVDWDGALQDRAALKQFGTAVWARINGQDPSKVDEEDSSSPGENTGEGHGKPPVTAKIEDTPAILEARETLDTLSEKYKALQRKHTALLSSAISAGQAVANVNLAALDAKKRSEIRESSEALETMKQKVSFQTLVYELERIYTYLAVELGNPAVKGYVPLQDRLNVAEFGLLETQIESFHRELDDNGHIDSDVLAVVMEQLTDFKRRLGIDYYVTGLTYDREAIERWSRDLLRKTKSGLMFYVKGTKLLWNDVVYCSSLIGKAATGYTLKPREVRNIRRTFKDIITFIPFVIILLIPLSPVGHVLVFGAIQRFFPDFFPSCFTEQRQNLLQLYETTEFSEVVIKENFQEKVTRLFEAMIFFIASKSRAAFRTMTDTGSQNSGAEDHSLESSSKEEETKG